MHLQPLPALLFRTSQHLLPASLLPPIPTSTAPDHAQATGWSFSNYSGPQHIEKAVTFIHLGRPAICLDVPPFLVLYSPHFKANSYQSFQLTKGNHQ